MGVLVASRHPPDALDETAFPRWYRRSAEPGTLIRRLAVRHFDSSSRAKPMLLVDSGAARGREARRSPSESAAGDRRAPATLRGRARRAKVRRHDRASEETDMTFARPEYLVE